MVDVCDDGDVAKILDHKIVPPGEMVSGADYTADSIRKD